MHAGTGEPRRNRPYEALWLNTKWLFVVSWFSSSSSCSSSSLLKRLQVSGHSTTGRRYDWSHSVINSVKSIKQTGVKISSGFWTEPTFDCIHINWNICYSVNFSFSSRLCSWLQMLRSFIGRPITNTRSPNRMHWGRPSVSSTMRWEPHSSTQRLIT